MDLFTLAATLTLDTSEYDQGIDESEEKASNFGSKLASAAKVGVGAFAAVSTAVVGTGTALVKGAGNVASYGDGIDKASQKMGISAKSYQEWDAVLQHSGTSIDVLKRAMPTLSKVAEKGAEEFQALGLSQEQVANMSQEELFDATIKGLQGMESGTERTALAQKLLGGSAKELGALLNTSAEDTQAMKDRVNELGGVMSDEAVKASAAYQDSLQDMQTAFSSISKNLISDFLPSMTTVMDGLTEVFSGDSDKGIALITQGVSDVLSKIEENIPKFMEIGSSIVSAIGQAIMQNFPSIVENGTQIVINLATGIISHIPDIVSMAMTMAVTIVTTLAKNLPKLVESGQKFISSMVSGIGGKAPDAINKMGDVLSQLITTIMQRMPDFLQKGVEFIGNMVEGIGRNLPTIITSLTGVLFKLIATIASNLPQFLTKGMELVANIWTGIVKMVPKVIEKLPEIVGKIADQFSQYDWLDIGYQIIAGIANGIINSAGAIVNAAVNAASAAFNAAKNWLGIESPSKVFRDKVGKMISEGMALGIEDGGDDVISAIEDMNEEMDDIDDPDFSSNDMVVTRSSSSEGDNDKKPSIVFSPTINVYGTEGQDVDELSEIVMDKITFMYDRERAAYGMA